MPTIFVVPAGEHVCREIYSADRVQSRAWPVPTRAASSCESQDHTHVARLMAAIELTIAGMARFYKSSQHL